jgi:rfaE bifunctional protein kinase chain/domain
MTNNIKDIFSKFENLNILIIGDVMVDSYVVGEVNRISPEAPVPVVKVSERYNRLGGAANVALNVKSLGANPILCSVTGNDAKGDEFAALLEKRQLYSGGIIKSDSRVTTTKFRVIGNNTQMLRVDEENTSPLSEADFVNITKAINDIFNKYRIDAVIFEDYDKGVIDKRLIDFINGKNKDTAMIITADPKRDNFDNYRGITLFKPNLKELSEGTSQILRNGDIGKIENAARELLEAKNYETVMVTLSEYGVLAVGRDDIFHIPAEVRTIADVSGAGDTVISTVTLALAAGMSLKESVRLANIAGGLVCEEVGVVPIDREKLIDESIKLMQ